jgi:predicted nucleotidyltransferase
MVHLKYWTSTCDIIEKYLNSLNLKVIDIFLVGSQVKTYIKSSDFDNVIIIEEKLGLLTANLIKIELDKIIRKDNPDFHFKLFTLSDLLLAQQYDAYRIYDFKMNNKSFKNSNVFNAVKPVLSIESFSNSILIQYVHKLNKFKLGWINKLAIEKNSKRWIDFNNEINRVSCIEKMGLKDARNENNLINTFHNEILKSKSNDKIVLGQFLSDYFKKIPHEYVNQSHVYIKGIIYEENFFSQL